MDVEIGEVIRRERLEHGWSQSELSFKTHISVRLISRYERGEGKPDIRNYFKIAEAFGWEMPWLREKAVGDDGTEGSSHFDWSARMASEQRKLGLPVGVA